MSNEREYLKGSSPAAAGPTGRDAGATDNSPGAQPGPIPSIALPKGGGAIRGIGEKFAANPVTGTGSMTIPIATSPGRSGFGPNFSLSYDSGAGNGPFGFGWNLSLPSITRKTDKGLPRYLEAQASDTFILSGAEDLVPVLVETAGRWEREPLLERTVNGEDYQVQHYRPRVEGLFARVEHWTNSQNGESHWRSVTRDNITTLYGKDDNSKIFASAPGTLKRVFSWLICESYDDKGNAIVYEYTAENDRNIDIAQSNERNRSRTANRYLKRIKYGNKISRLRQPDLTTAEWLFEVVLDYDEAHYELLAPVPELPEDEQHRFVRATSARVGDWTVRPDPFSSYRAGFEVRTHRRCHRILMFHRFDELGEEPCLVRSTDFEYADFDYSHPTTIETELAHRGSSRFASFISKVTQSGYTRDDSQPVLERNGARYHTFLKKSLPSIEFTYSKAIIQEEVEDIDRESIENLPIGLDGTNYRWTDLDGEGLCGLLTQQGNAWFYKGNLSPLQRSGEDLNAPVVARFAPVKQLPKIPLPAELAAGRQFMDLAGDGQIEVVDFAPATPGFTERTADEDWERFRSFESLPSINWGDPNLRFVDLTGDGRSDVLITEDEALTWYSSMGEEGFGAAEKVHQALSEEKGPRLLLADGTQSVYLADMSGDGLTDLVRIRNGEVSYWPNLGYGRFGAKVTMDASPWFDTPDLFDQRRIRLADIDGSGVTDILYLRSDGVRLYFNQSGNRWSDVRPLQVFPRVNDLSAVTVVDLLGNGTACLVWSSPVPADTDRQMRYVRLMKDKPHLLIGMANNLGAETRIRYAPSTRFYLEDKAAGNPWITKLPFLVHVVEQVEVYDYISRNRFTSRYAYHHGYFDGTEREFRGFGMVEQWDTETMAALTADGAFPQGDNINEASHVPPVHTKTWFHTGVYLGRNRVSQFHAGLLNTHDRGEYYREPLWRDDDLEASKRLLADTVLPAGLTAAEENEACRALKGMMLRQEVYAVDGTAKAAHPYTVTEQNFTVVCLQPQDANRHGVFFSHSREVLNYHYERNPTDPRVAHTLTLSVDQYGNVLRSVSIGYGRANVPERQPEQAETHLMMTLNRVANRDDQFDGRRLGMPVETRTYEVVKPPQADLRYGWEEMRDLVEALVPSDQIEPAAAKTISYEEWDWRKRWNPLAEPGGLTNSKLRLIEHVRTLYRPDDLGVARNDVLALLPLATVESLAVPGEIYKLAFTPGLLAAVFQRPLNIVPTGSPAAENLLPTPTDVLAGAGGDRGGYVDLDSDGKWWIPSGRVFFSPGASDSAAAELAYAREHFFKVLRQRDPFHSATSSTESFITYDDYDLLALNTEDPVANQITAGERDAAGNVTPSIDYRVLQPRMVMDPNRNRSAVMFDTLGMVVGTVVMGKPPPAPVEGDRFDAFDADLTEVVIRDHVANPVSDPQSILQHATTRLVYELFAYQRTKGSTNPQPAVVYTLERESHDSDPVPVGGLKFRHSLSYTDGFGREIQKKRQAEAGPVPQRGADGKIVLRADGQPEMTPGDVSPRWVGSGWTIFNNKGKPVRQYEPFFTDTPGFEFDVRIGISPILYYDPTQRVVATLHPNHTWEKVIFDPWRQETWDVNDTVLLTPQNDAEVSGFFLHVDGSPRLLPAAYLPSWNALRTDPAHAAEASARWPEATIRNAQRAAAEKAAVHAATPTLAHFDSLGRVFLTIVHNKFKYSDTPPTSPPTEEFYRSLTVFDIEGNQHEIVDAKGRVVIRYEYDLLSNRIHQASMEAGERWMLDDATGKSIRAWDSRAHTFRTEYDPLRRPVRVFVTGANPEHPAEELLTERLVYGEQHPEDELRNLRGALFLHLDQAGAASQEAHDFKCNLLRASRRLAREYKQTLDWSAVDTIIPTVSTARLDLATLEAALAPLLEVETYSNRTAYDAVNRPVQIIPPRSDQLGSRRNITQPRYNEGGLLEGLDVWLEHPNEPAGLLDAAVTPPSPVGVNNINYDARGRRQRIEYKNGAATRYLYEPDTLRLMHLYTRRGATFTDDCGNDPPPPRVAAPDLPPPSGTPCALQNIHYTYDPAGNLTHIRDDGRQRIYFSNTLVEPSAEYTYDSVYRLLEATGREHLGQIGAPPRPGSYNDQPRVGILLSASDGDAVGRYAQRYRYDAVGNFAEMVHRGTSPANPGWTRSYDYNEDSQLEPAQKSNRLTSTTIGATTETYSSGGNSYDAHGNMLGMPQLANMQWDFKDQLQMTQRQAVNADDDDGTEHQGERTWYVYDASGQRLRKVTELVTDQIREERIYLGGFEIYRRRGINPLVRETLHVMDDKQRIALVETRTEGAEAGLPPQLIRYQFGNHLGSASLELDHQAQIISYEEYYPYGNTSFQAVRNQTEAPKRYRYTGKERDEESGLYYHGARYYASWLGRWVSCDPLGFGDGLNLYEYVRGNPCHFIDETGKQAGPWTGYVRARELTSAINQSPTARFAAEHPELGVLAAAGGAFVVAAAIEFAPAVLLFAVTHPVEVTTATAFGVGVVDPHPPGASPLDIPGPVDDAGRVTRRVVEGVVDDVARTAPRVADDIARAVPRVADDVARASPRVAPQVADDAVRAGERAVSRAGDDAVRATGDTVTEGARALVDRARSQLDDITRIVERQVSRRGRDIYAEVRNALARADALSPQQKVEAFESAVARINQIDPSWLANRGPATNAVGFFTGDARPFGFAVDAQGRVWQTLDIGESVTFGRNAVATIDFSKWTLIQ